MHGFEAIVMHHNPIGRSASNYVARVDLSVFDLGNQIEQVWLTEAGNGIYHIACIPFSCYGVAYRDSVRLDDDGAYVASVVTKSGNRVLRALITDTQNAEALVSDLRQVARESGVEYELYGAQFIAFNIELNSVIDGLLTLIQSALAEGRLYFEWADSLEFRPPVKSLGTDSPN